MRPRYHDSALCLPAMRAWLALVPTAVAAVLPSCSPNAICKMGGPINDPSNRTLRRNIMSYGLSQFCQQMTTHSAPLKMTPDAPVTGRFYPQHCTQKTLDNGDLWVQFDGTGYAFTPLSRKVSFTSGATIQYNDDFRCADDASIYAYFATRTVSPPQFQLMQIEASVANLVQGWVGPYANSFGTQMVSSQLAQGFTVIQGNDGSIDFDIGQLKVGQRPAHPFDVHGQDRVMIESLRTQVYPNERDFIGPIEVKDSGRALYLTMQLDGLPSVRLLLLPKPLGDAALQVTINQGPVGAIAGIPQWSDVLPTNVQYQRAVPVAPGMYYVVIDTTPSGGQVAPPAAFPLGGAEQPAVISYEIQIGDAT
jgi:hypothetical protein